ncbi:MAG: twin-arginine translocation signal domain-containing protein [Rhodocyclales bacterium]|nr:twin-arginine translocation signal domain-containing protein [Rhodocyclales bacterium]
MLTRRQFLKAGLAGGAALALGGAWFAASRSDDEVDALFAAISAAALAGALPTDAASRTTAIAGNVVGMRRAVAGLSAAAQDELDQLFGLLCFAPSRLLLAGIRHPWREVSAGEAARFLESWRDSRFALLQSAYAALHDIALGAWYGDAGHWAAIGYGGPPAIR